MGETVSKVEAENGNPPDPERLPRKMTQTQWNEQTPSTHACGWIRCRTKVYGSGHGSYDRLAAHIDIYVLKQCRKLFFG